MLSFLEDRTDNVSANITGIQRKPNWSYGVSYETPKQFTNDATMLSEKSYVNPHLKYENLRLSKMALCDKQKVIDNSWIHKSNINLIEEEKVLGSDKRISRYHDNHQNTLTRNHTLFRSVKGEFTHFIHHQYRNKVLGPIEGHERTPERARETRKRILQQSITSLERIKQYLSEQYSSPNAQSKIKKSNFQRARQKRGIRHNRRLLYDSIQLECQSRRFRHSPEFVLPKVLKQHMLEKNQSKFYKEGFYTIDCKSLKRIGLDQSNERYAMKPAS